LATKGLAVASQQCTVSHCLFHQGFFYQNNKTAIPHPPYFSLFPHLKIKLKGCLLIQLIEAELQAVLNTLMEHNSQDAFKNNGRSAGNDVYVWKGTILRLMVASRPIVTF
jgi:hypothetical protein